MLSDRCPVCLTCPVCLSVCDGVLWPNGCMHQDETWHGGRPQPWPHCVRRGPRSPSLKRGQSPQFSAHVYCGQTDGWMNQDATWYGGRPLPRPHYVRWGHGFPQRGHSRLLNFRPMSILANGRGRPSQLLLSTCCKAYDRGRPTDRPTDGQR